MQISICPSNPPHCFFYQRHKNPLRCALISQNWSFFKILAGPNAPKYQKPEITIEYLVRFCLLAVVTRLEP